jgi:hypothetical protein
VDSPAFSGSTQNLSPLGVSALHLRSSFDHDGTLQRLVRKVTARLRDPENILQLILGVADLLASLRVLLKRTVNLKRGAFEKRAPVRYSSEIQQYLGARGRNSLVKRLSRP